MAPPTPEARLLGLASWILDQRSPVTRQQIYEAFPRHYGGNAAAREKKFGRDKNALEALGFVLVGEPLGGQEEQWGYRIDARASSLPRIDLSPDEAAVVWTAALSALRLSDHPLRDELESAIRKLSLGAQVLPRATDAGELSGEPPPADAKVLDRIVSAWQRRKRLTLDYYRVASDEVVRRDVDVHGWARRRGEWIFVGHCHLRGAPRLFYLSRVRSAKVNPRKPSLPDYQIPADFDVRAWTQQQVWDYHVHAPRPAAIRFTGSLVRLASRLVPDVPLEKAADGSRVARLQVRDLRGLVRQALAWGPEAEIVEPPEARALARQILDGLAGGLGRSA